MHSRNGSHGSLNAAPKAPHFPSTRTSTAPPPPPSSSSSSTFERGSLATGNLVGREDSSMSSPSHGHHSDNSSTPHHKKSRSISVPRKRTSTITRKKIAEIPILLQSFSIGAWDREVFFGLENPPVEQNVVTKKLPPCSPPDVPLMSLYDLLARLHAKLPYSTPLAMLNHENLSLPNDGNLRYTVRRLELLLDVFIHAVTDVDGMACCCDVTVFNSTSERKAEVIFNPSRNFGLTTNLINNPLMRTEDTLKRGPYDCLLLLTHAFLSFDGPEHLVSLIRGLCNHSDSELKEYVADLRETGLEWGLKIIWVVDQVRDSLAICQGAVPLGIFSCTKSAWWQQQALLKTVSLLDSPPLCVFETLFEVLSGRIQTSRDRVSGYLPLARVVRFRDTEAMLAISNVWQKSNFEQLELSLQYLIHCLGKAENLVVVLNDKCWYRYFIPLLITGGAHIPQNLRFRAINSYEAQTRVDLIIRLVVSICIIILHAAFMDVTCSSDENQQKTPSIPIDTTRLSRSRDRKSSFSSLFSHTSSSTDKTLDKIPDIDTLLPPLPPKREPEMYSTIILSFFDSIEAVALWTPDTVVLQRIMLEALLTKLSHDSNTFRQDTTSHIWENLFQLCFVLENFIFYSPVSDGNLIRPMAERHFTDPGIHHSDDVPLVTSFVEFLQNLRVETLSSEVYDNVISKKKCNAVKKRTLEELTFWLQAKNYLSIVGTMDEKALKKSKAYKVCENALRQRRNGYRQMRKEMLGAVKERKRPQAVRAAPPIPKLEVQKTFHEADLLETTVQKFSSRAAEQSYWKSHADALFKAHVGRKKRADSRSRSQKSRSITITGTSRSAPGSPNDVETGESVAIGVASSSPQGWWAGRKLRRMSPQSILSEQKLRQLSELKRRQSDESVSMEETKQARDLENEIIGFRDFLREEKSNERISFRDFLKESKNDGICVLTDFDDVLCAKPDSEDEEDPLLWLEAAPDMLLPHDEYEDREELQSEELDEEEVEEEEEDEEIPLPPPKESPHLQPTASNSPHCAWCGAGPTDDGFHALDQQPFCKDCCRLKLVCAGCGGRFVENNKFTRATIPSLFEGDQPVTLLYHTSCFVCAEDKKPFDIVTDGTYPNIRGNAKQLYCLNHFSAKFGNKCAHCNEVIEKVTVWCLERTWHPEHLLCSNNCGARLNEHKLNIPTAKEWARMETRGHPLTASSYRTRVGFCESCYDRDVVDECKGCRTPFQLGEEAALVADGQRMWSYHLQCYKCVGCAVQSKEQMNGKGLTYHQNLLLCSVHLQAANRGAMPAYCSRCLGVIDKGKAVKVHESSYHPACLICSKCGIQLDCERFAGPSPPPLMLCPVHLEKQLQGSSCEACFDPILEGTAYSLNGGRYHDACMVCYQCKVRLGGVENTQVRISPPHAPEHLRNLFWCSEHFMQHFNPFCNICKERIMGTAMMLGSIAHHRECLRCETCKVHLESHQIAECRGVIYCQEHILPALIKAASLGYNLFRDPLAPRVMFHGHDEPDNNDHLSPSCRPGAGGEISPLTSSPVSEGLGSPPRCVSPSASTTFHDASHASVYAAPSVFSLASSLSPRACSSATSSSCASNSCCPSPASSTSSLSPLMASSPSPYSSPSTPVHPSILPSNRARSSSQLIATSTSQTASPDIETRSRSATASALLSRDYSSSTPPFNPAPTAAALLSPRAPTKLPPARPSSLPSSPLRERTSIEGAIIPLNEFDFSSATPTTTSTHGPISSVGLTPPAPVITPKSGVAKLMIVPSSLQTAQSVNLPILEAVTVSDLSIGRDSPKTTFATPPSPRPSRPAPQRPRPPPTELSPPVQTLASSAHVTQISSSSAIAHSSTASTISANSSSTSPSNFTFSSTRTVSTVPSRLVSDSPFLRGNFASSSTSSTSSAQSSSNPFMTLRPTPRPPPAPPVVATLPRVQIKSTPNVQTVTVPKPVLTGGSQKGSVSPNKPAFIPPRPVETVESISPLKPTAFRSSPPSARRPLAQNNLSSISPSLTSRLAPAPSRPMAVPVGRLPPLSPSRSPIPVAAPPVSKRPNRPPPRVPPPAR